MRRDYPFGLEATVGYPLRTRFLPAMFYVLAAIALMALVHGVGI